ncbi:mitosis inhibitor protein kinase swe1 [Ophidiomyces ophidiicola]|nr:mitosis inhibitor protein kinase swe1 [Ophidiomyces ophidiicola]KAI2144647.1 mitosis inhibitor protein kinase swe1 [Ophidiomyces ophidiicola]KAI2410976.1 mitosis inhibitor protein kinase swe1 [Ophidiomyces ophidiicola]
MVASFSPHRDAGGTLHFPSPSSLHHTHTNSALNELRRSLSRSPSKGADFRILSPSRLHSSPAKPGQFFSSLSQSKRGSSPGNLLFVSSTTSPPVASPLSPSARIHRPGLRRYGNLSSSSRLRTMPLSPAKRALTESRDNGNAGSFQAVKEDSDNKPAGPAIAMDSCTSYENPNNVIVAEDFDDKTVPKLAPSRIEKRRSGNFGALSPLKRTDGFMNLDQASCGSPVPKRRSLHGANFGSEFDVFEHAANTPDIISNEAKEHESTGSLFPQSPSLFSTVPKRSSSLRKSTLQQRQNDRQLFRKGSVDQSPEVSTPAALRNNASGVRDNGIFSPLKRDSFTPSGSIFTNTSTPAPVQFTGFAQPTLSAHPLSRTITQSSSDSSLADDSPTHAPGPARPLSPRPILNFSKSLPAGSSKPLVSSRLQHEESNGSEASFATPESYRFVKPLPAAFFSTGLISKKNRNAADVLNPPLGGKNMPDTPCKRASFIPTRKPFSQSFDSDKFPFGPSSSPWTPTNTSVITSKPRAPKGMGIFGRNFIKPPPSRRGSFVSIDGEDDSQYRSPSAGNDTQNAMDSDLPPTPTKQTFGSSASQFSLSQTQLNTSNTPGSMFENGGVGPCSSPLHHKSIDHMSPHTPQEHILPPDPSGLSISAFSDHRPGLDSSLNFPATPTGPRESFPQLGKRSTLSLNNYSSPDVDSCLTSRFDKVELIGTGEFSQVYCVTERQSMATFQATVPGSSKKLTSPLHLWAVKKSKQPFTGIKDRERRCMEVVILKALTNSDHVISFVDSWENNNYLYIQTEFCEEGSLDVFLSQVGLKARLDDFRIWKILLELSHGLKCVHDSGFIHLDLKPANILITFEGVLKIADFGMAACWPAADGIEGEGDREYIGPEILQGRYDKPADIFALGLIMFEIAGNVELPDNGLSWQKLRNGDISDVPSLTWSSETSIPRDATGNPLSSSCSFEDSFSLEEPLTLDMLSGEQHVPQVKPHLVSVRSGELSDPPDFMIDPNNVGALDKIVRWMISPDPADRPVAAQVIQSFGVQWTERRRRAGATIYEGNWGPADEVLVEDAEMIDV